MKLNLQQKIEIKEGQPYRIHDQNGRTLVGDAEKGMRLGDVIAFVLRSATQVEGQKVDGPRAYHIGLLFFQVEKATEGEGTLDMGVEDVSFVKELLPKVLPDPPLIALVWDILDPKPKQAVEAAN